MGDYPFSGDSPFFYIALTLFDFVFLSGWGTATHVRNLVGYVRYDSPAALEALNALYADLRLFQNLWLPSVKLDKKLRVGSRLRRQYDRPQTPFESVRACRDVDATKVVELARLCDTLDPFALAERIDQQLSRLYTLANHRRSPQATKPVDAAGPVKAKNASTSALENPKNGFSTATTGPLSRHHAEKTSVTRLMARRFSAR